MFRNGSGSAANVQLACRWYVKSAKQYRLIIIQNAVMQYRY